MIVTNACVKRILQQKGVFHLYHANTVPTACTFLENGGLLSRGAVERGGLFQTSQTSDASDQELGVFDDIFFDSADNHRRARSRNKYGPVLFVYSIDLIDQLPEGIIGITKDNPIYWSPDLPEAERYFMTEQELLDEFYMGQFRQHFTIRNQTQPLSFAHLEKVILDDPAYPEAACLEGARRQLAELLCRHAPWAPLEIRQCPPECRCKAEYAGYEKGFFYYNFGFESGGC